MFKRFRDYIGRKRDEYSQTRKRIVAKNEWAEATAGGLIATFVALIVTVIFSQSIILPLLNNLSTTAGLTGSNATIAGFLPQIFLIGLVVMVCRWMGLV